MRKKDNTDYYINRHSCFLLQYHIVFVTKYRHPVLTGKVKDVVYERIHYVADQRGFHILEINGESDHVHILMEADTTTSPAELANVLKTQTGQEFLKTKQDKNNFLIGNLLPDTTKIKARSHFRDPKYHDRMIEYPETSWFIKKYKHLLSNSSVVGYLFHLYIDRRFFKYYMPRIVEFRNAQDEREERRDMVKDVLLKRTGQRLSKQDFFSEKYYYGDYTKMNMYLVNRYQIPTTLDSHISNPGIKEVDYEDVKQVLKELKTYLKVPEDAVKNVRVFDVEDLLFFLENAVNEFKI